MRRKPPRPSAASESSRESHDAVGVRTTQQPNDLDIEANLIADGVSLLPTERTSSFSDPLVQRVRELRRRRLLRFLADVIARDLRP
ncbi:MAG: hypothetical protein ACJ8C4_15290 [Gemmataceae bacterium]